MRTPPMDRTARMFGEPGDLARNGAPPAGVHANLAQPSTPDETRAKNRTAPVRSLLDSPIVPVAVLVGVYLYLNG